MEKSKSMAKRKKIMKEKGMHKMAGGMMMKDEDMMMGKQGLSRVKKAQKNREAVKKYRSK